VKRPAFLKIAVPDSENTMRSLLENLLLRLTVVILSCTLTAGAHLAMAVVLPPETLAPEEETVPSELAPEPEPSPHPDNPFRESAKPDAYELMRQKHEKTTIYVIVGVVFLLCVYWWTSGKLHHKIPQ